MKHIILFLAMATCTIVTKAQEQVFNYEITSIKKNGKAIAIPTGKSYAIMTVSGGNGNKMFMLNGRDIVSSGGLLLISKSEIKETANRYGGYTIVWSWDKVTDAGVKMPTKVVMRVILTNEKIQFVCDMTNGNYTYQYAGVVTDISDQ